DGAVPRSCDRDSDCSGRESCICGRCMASACSIGADCGEGFTCPAGGGACVRTCSADGDCAADEKCSLGGCARRCSEDADCGCAERCSVLFGSCEAQSCNDVLGCGSGKSCLHQQVVGEVREPAIVTTSAGRFAYVEIREGTKGSVVASIHRARVVSP